MHSAQPALLSVAAPVGHWMLQSLEQMLQVSRNASHSSWKWTFQLRHPPQPTLTVLAALAGVAGRAQTGSGGRVTAGIVGTVGADLLAARSPETLRASWSVSRQRTAPGSEPRWQREMCALSGSLSPSLLCSCKTWTFVRSTWPPASTARPCLFHKQRASPLSVLF